MMRTMLAAALVLSLSCPALAGPVGIELTATVTSVDDFNDALGGAVQVNDVITVKYVYDSDTLPSGTQYLYDSAPYGIVVRMGTLIAQTNPSSVNYYIAIEDGTAGGGSDAYVVYSSSNLSVPSGIVFEEIAVQLSDPSGTALTSSALPLTAPVLADWSSAELLISNMPDPDDPDTFFAISATVTSAALAVDPYDPLLLPEPATMSLLGIGLTALAMRRKAKA